MNFRDHWAVNRRGEQFIFTVEMQRRLSEAGLPVEPDALEQLESRAAVGGGRTGVRDTARQSYEQRPSERDYRSAERDYPPGDRDHRPADREAPRREQAESQPEIVGPDSVQIDPMTGKYIGRVKWYNAKKGYGFILRGGNEEIFFHRSSAVGDPLEFPEGQWVLYDVEDTDKGPEASDVEPYEENQ
jgi:CspA family cold shock protein